jgi:glyoxylase-like metal-dependent hydrolase (beta-lactamase superfamily II)
MIAPGADIARGIRAIDTAGHTAGHISVEIASGNEIALVLADALVHPIISFAHPEWSPAADHHDPDRAIAARKRLLSRLASDHSLAIGFHLPFPGIGWVEMDGSAYRFVPMI